MNSFVRDFLSNICRRVDDMKNLTTMERLYLKCLLTMSDRERSDMAAIADELVSSELAVMYGLEE